MSEKDIIYVAGMKRGGKIAPIDYIPACFLVKVKCRCRCDLRSECYEKL